MDGIQKGTANEDIRRVKMSCQSMNKLFLSFYVAGFLDATLFFICKTFIFKAA
jgi:hypothetical protein